MCARLEINFTVEHLTLQPLLLVMTLASQQRAESATEGDTIGCLLLQRVAAIIKLSEALLQLHGHKNNKWCEMQRCTFPQLEMWLWEKKNVALLWKQT